MLLKPLLKSIRVGTPLAQYPLTLFANGEQGIWLDPSDLSTLFQDAAGTTPVTLDGDPVGLVLDKSGNGNHATQSISASRPTYRTDGILHWLEFDGVDDYFVTGNIDLTATDEISIFTGIRKLSDATIGCVLEFSNNINFNTGCFAIFAPISNGIANLNFSSKGTVAVGVAPTGYAAPISVVLNCESKISTDVTRMSVNKIPVSSINDLGSGNYGNHALYIGRRGGSSLPFNGNIYSLLMVGVDVSSTLESTTERYLARKSGVTL